MVRFQPPSATVSRNDVQFEQRPAPGRHRFAAPALDDEEEEVEDGEGVDEDDEVEHEEHEYDDEYESKYDDESERGQSSLYPKLSPDRRASPRRRRVIDEDEEEEEGAKQQNDFSTSRNNQLAPASSKKRFVADVMEDEEEVKAEDESITLPTPSPSTSYLTTPSLLFTPGSQTAASSDPAILLSSALASLPPPPSSTQPSSIPVPVLSTRATRWRKSFRAGWGVDGRVVLIEGGKVTITKVKGEEEEAGKTADVVQRERQGRAEMRLRLLTVHREFSEWQRSEARGDGAGAATSSFSSLVGGASISSSSPPSTSPLALLCDRYIAALTPLFPSFPLPPLSAVTGTRSSFSVATQLRQTVNVFQLVKILYAPEFGAASLDSILSEPLHSSSSSFNVSASAATLYGERYARLFHLIRYLEEELKSAQHPPPSFTSSSTFPPLFSLLSSHLIPEATEAALSHSHFRVATLLPSLSSISSSFTSLIACQLADWKNSGMWDVMDGEEQRVWMLMAGDKQAKEMEWLRGMAMYVFYQEEGKGDVREGIRGYWQAVKEGKAKRPLPPYQVEEKDTVVRDRRRRIDDDEDDDDLQMNGSHLPSSSSNEPISHHDVRSERLHTAPVGMQRMNDIACGV